MKNNSWMKEGGFYGKDAPIISGAGLDIAAHPQVLIKQADASKIMLEETTDKYRAKMLGLVWTSKGFDDKIGDYESYGNIILEIMRKLKSGGDLNSREAEVFFELFKSGIIKRSGVQLDKVSRTACLEYELGSDLSDIFEDAEDNSAITDTLRRVDGTLKETELNQEIWIEALKCCQDASFKPNLKVMNSTVIMEELMLRLRNPIILLRYHGLQMEAYRGTNKGNDHWISENGPSCTSCGEEIAGSQNFTRAAGAALHTSCIPDYLNKNHVDQKHATYMKAVYDAMFPQRVPVK